MIYFAETPSIPDQVKIGYSSNLTNRMRGLTSSFGTVMVIATIEGGEDREKLLHTAYADDRVEGEWFRRSPGMDKLIAVHALSEPLIFVSKSQKPSTAVQTDDRRLAKRLINRFLHLRPVTMTTGAALEELYQELQKTGRPWGRRRIRTLHEMRALRIDFSEMVDLFNVAGADIADWGNILGESDGQ